MKEIINELIKVLNTYDVAHTPCNHELCDDHFDEAMDRLQDSTVRIVTTFTDDLGDHFANETAIVALLGCIHESAGAEACLSTIRECLSALNAWETSPSRERLKLVPPASESN